MEQKEVAGSLSKPPRPFSVRSLASRLFLEFRDFASVIACFCTVLGLIYLTFFKDFLDIFLYAVFKYVNRIKWLYKISRIDSLFEGFYEIERKYRVHSHPQKPGSSCTGQISNSSSRNGVSPDGSAQKQLLKYSPSTPCSAKSKLFIYPQTIDFILEPSRSDEANSVPMNTSPEANTSLTPEKIALLSESCAVSNPMQDIDLSPVSNYEAKKVFATTEQKTQDRKKRFGWNFSRFKDTFGKGINIPSIHRVKEKCEDLAATVAQILPSKAGDLEKLTESSDSSENVGCCDAILSCFKSNLETKDIISYSVHYERF